MRPVGVELGPPVIEALLLSGHVALRGPRRLRFERPVHPFMGPVLLRLPGVDALVVDPELDPPDREPAQTANGLGRERRPVVRPDRRR